jgi:hypothetical protein
MSNPDPADEQGLAEALDESTLGAEDVDDIGEDVVRTAYPPDRQQGVDVPSPLQQVPDELPPEDDPVTGLLEVDDGADAEVAELGDAEPLPPAEEAAVHETEPPPLAP